MAFNDKLTVAKQATSRFFRRLFFGIIILSVLGLILSYILTKVSYSEGERAGTVSKFSKRGYFIKTFEGELNVGAQGQVGNMQNNLWDFTVADADSEVAKVLQDALLTGKRIRVHYEQRYLKFSWMGDTEYFVTKVDEAP